MKSFNRTKPGQELMTLLEPRRLMSLTGGVDYTPAPDAAPTQISHSFGYEHALVDGGDAHQPIPMNMYFGGVPFGFNNFDAQFARAIAQGSPISFMDPNVGNGSDLSDAASHAIHANAFTTMYASLSNSTVNSIDLATAAATTAASTTLSAISDTTFHASVSGVAENAVNTSATAATQLNQDSSVSVATTSVASVSNPATFNSNIASAVALPSPLLGASTNAASNTDISAPPRITLQVVEQELLTVSTLASEMISQLGRDIAIELSHLESSLSFDAIGEQLSTHMDGWRSAAAVTGAAIATIVYIQSEADLEKPKTNSTFSNRLIEAIPS